MSKKTRRQFSAEQRAAILRRHFGDKVAVSQVCEEHGIQPSVFYRWQTQMLENMAVALADGRGQRADHAKSKINKLERQLKAREKELSHKDEVIAELAESYVTLKKNDGTRS